MLPIGNLMLDATASPVRRRFNHLCRSPADTQQALLSAILHENANTAFGKRHGFSAITTFRQYQERVPLSTYEDLEPYISAAMNGAPNQLTTSAPVLYTTTSGTTGASKFIPVTQRGRSRKAHLMWLWLSALHRDHPGMTAGKILSVVSPAVESHTPDGTPTGAESGHTYRNMPPPVRWMYSAPYEVFTVDDYEAKYYALLRLAAGQDISCIATANPSTVVLLAERLGQHTEQIIRDVNDGTFSTDFAIPASIRAEFRLHPDPERAHHLEQAAALGDGVLRPGLAWPMLAAIGCWKGGTVTSYLTQFETYFPQRPPVRDLGYLATELSGSVPLSDEGDAGVVAVGTNVVEFRPAYVDGKPQGSDLIPLERLEVGQRYFVYVTTVSGLYRYDMNDIVEVTGRHENTPLIRFVQKGKGVVSFTGEKLYEIQVIAAVEEALAARRGRHLFIAALAELVDRLPRLTYLIEFDDDVTDQEGAVLADRLDAALGNQNAEYHSKRASLRYGAPTVRVVRSGELDRYRRRRVESGCPDGQFKVLRLTTDASFAAEFKSDREFVGGGGRRFIA
jgi:GH3 auxin-responsive promoter